MSFVTKAADSLLSVIVPRATAEAWTCPNGCSRQRCTGCLNHRIYNRCINNQGGGLCHGCRETVYTC
jgi:hypothetical protein